MQQLEISVLTRMPLTHTQDTDTDRQTQTDKKRETEKDRDRDPYKHGTSSPLVDMRGVGTEEASFHYPASSTRLEADPVPLVEA